MEGVEQNYQGIYCLDTIKAFDEKGFQYWHTVRPGNTFSSNGSGEIIHEIFNRMPKTKSWKTIHKYVRADSAFCNTEFFNACSAKSVGFVTRMRENMLSPLVKNIIHWHRQNPVKKNSIRFYDGRECEIGETTYRPENGAELLRVVVMRAERPLEPGLLFKIKEYDYFAFVTNLGCYHMNALKIIRFYRARGHAETS